MTNPKFILINPSKLRSVFVILLVLPIFFLLPETVKGQKPKVVTSINKDTLLIGEPTAMDISITVPRNAYTITWPEKGAQLNSFQVTDAGGPADSLPNGKSITYNKRIYITGFDSGSHILPPIRINFAGADKNSSFSVSTQKLPIEIVFSKDDGVRPFHDIKSVIEVPNSSPTWLKYLIASSILLILFLVYLLIKKKKTSPSKDVASIDPYKEAMGAISQLRSELATGEKSNKENFNRLIFIFKRYLSLSAKENKMPLTNSELISDLHEEMPDKELFSKTANLINLSEAVIFAKFTVSNKSLSDSIDQMKSVIDYLNKKEVK